MTTDDERYSILKAQGAAKVLETEIGKALDKTLAEGICFFILDFSVVSGHPTATFIPFLVALQKKIENAAAALVIYGLEDRLSSALQRLGITCVPTMDEAKDYILMEIIEKELRESEGENL